MPPKNAEIEARSAFEVPARGRPERALKISALCLLHRAPNGTYRSCRLYLATMNASIDGLAAYRRGRLVAVYRRAVENQNDGEDLEIGSTILDMATAIVPVAAGDPTVGALGALTTLGLSIGVKGVLARRQRRRLTRLEEAIEEVAGSALPELMSRIENVERSAVLAELALRSTISATVDDQATANGRLLVHGVLENAHEEAEFVMKSVAQLSELEIRALEALRSGSKDSADHLVVGALLAEVVPDEMTDAVLASLAGRGMVRLDPPGFGGFHLTPLGMRVADQLRLPTDP